VEQNENLDENLTDVAWNQDLFGVVVVDVYFVRLGEKHADLDY